MTMAICSVHYILKVEEKIPWTEEPGGFTVQPGQGSQMMSTETFEVLNRG